MPQLLVLQSWPASNWLLKKNTWTNFVILDLQNYRVTQSHCHILLTCSVLDIFFSQTQLPTRNSCQLLSSGSEVSRPLPSEETRLAHSKWFHQLFYIKIIKTPMARPKTKRQFGPRLVQQVSRLPARHSSEFDAPSFQRENRSRQSKLTETHCCCLQITLYSGVEIWGTTPHNLQTLWCLSCWCLCLSLQTTDCWRKTQRHQN